MFVLRKTSIFSALFAIFSFYVYMYSKLSINSILELDQCPFCYGVDFCNSFDNNEINLKTFFQKDFFFNLISTKNVYLAEYNSKNIVLKKLANTNELKIFDETYATQKNTFSTEHLKNSIIKHITENSDYVKNLKMCSVKDANAFFEYIVNNKSQDINKNHLIKNIWTIIHLNPEPLILQLLQPSDHWPVPLYYGACGRLIVEEYCGQNLNYFKDSNWTFRANLALQLLNGVKNFTYHHSEFQIYLTDISPDNIVVNERGILKFVDLENIIVKQKGKDLPQNKHQSSDMDCSDCFAYSEKDICEHDASDHNFYAVCKLILSSNAPWPMFENGLLHTPPTPVTEDIAYLFQLIEYCVKPKKDMNRFEIIEEIILELENTNF